MKRYQATATQVNQLWHIEVPEIDRVTQAEHLREAETMARDLIAIMTDRKPNSFEVDLQVVLPKSVRAHLQAAEKLRKQSAEAQAKAAQEVRAAARELHAAGLPLRDVGVALGVSYQRVHQLVS